MVLTTTQFRISCGLRLLPIMSYLLLLSAGGSGSVTTRCFFLEANAFSSKISTLSFNKGMQVRRRRQVYQQNKHVNNGIASHGLQDNNNNSNRIQRDLVSRNLFFRTTYESDTGTTSIQKRRRRIQLQPSTIKELQSSSLELPYEFKNGDKGTKSTVQDGSSWTLRFMTNNDLKEVLPMCIKEFGTGPTMTIFDFPWQNLNSVSDWWDRFSLEPYIASSLITKMKANENQQQQKQKRQYQYQQRENNMAQMTVTTTTTTTTTSTTTKVSGKSFLDPALVVLSVRVEDDKETVVGMVELSLQPPEANRSPPNYPIPTPLKELYGKVTGQKLQGWVTNLLIDPQYRGLGYSKVLMTMTEGIAKSWGCDSIYLHADAGYKTGKVPQRLYESLGYEVVKDDNPLYAWMGDNGNPFDSIRMIQGVALLCYCKRL